MLRLHYARVADLEAPVNLDELDREIDILDRAITTRRAVVAELDAQLAHLTAEVTRDAVTANAEAEAKENATANARAKQVDAPGSERGVCERRGRKRKWKANPHSQAAQQRAKQQARLSTAGQRIDGERRLVTEELHAQVEERDRLVYKRNAAKAGPQRLIDYLLDASPYLNEYHTTTDQLQSDERAAIEAVERALPGTTEALQARNDLIGVRQTQCAFHNDITKRFTAKFFPQNVSLEQRKRDAALQLEAMQHCPRCDARLEKSNDGKSEVCPGKECGFARELKDFGVSYDTLKGRQRPGKKFKYLRIMHARDYLRRLQGRGGVPPSPVVLAALRAEFRKSRTSDAEIRPDLVRKKLKKLGLSHLYEREVGLTMALNPEYKAVVFEASHEEDMLRDAVQAERAFEETKAGVCKERINFLSYPFAMYKICERRGWKQYLPAFTLLKSDKLLARQDKFWKAICLFLDWSYIPTVGNVNISAPWAAAARDRRRRPQRLDAARSDSTQTV